MASPATPSKQVQVKEPEIRAWAIINAGPAMWTRREYLIQGDRVVAYTDHEADAKAPTIGRIIRGMERTP